jgi:hypothetical protein
VVAAPGRGRTSSDDDHEDRAGARPPLLGPLRRREAHDGADDEHEQDRRNEPAADTEHEVDPRAVPLERTFSAE